MTFLSKNHLTDETYALVLAGGRGRRLHQLTDWRCKPAVPFAGKFNIIDFALSNCVNSGIRHVGVLTQYKAQSLISHIQHGWSFLAANMGEHVDVIPAQQQGGEQWYRGTADAVYQNLSLIDEVRPKRVLVLAGDHIYKMDYSIMLAEHAARGAELTVACLEVPLAQASDFGVMVVDEAQRIVAFDEKPAHPQALPERPTHALSSMGIYVFETDFLIDTLVRDAANPHSHHDFGKDIIGSLLTQRRVYAHSFKNSCVNMVGATPYWRDVGTVDAYWEANIDLTSVVPDLNLYDEDWPVLSLQHQLAPAKVVFEDADRRGQAFNSLLSGGCIVSGATVRRTVLFPKVRVGEGSLIEDSVILPEVVIGQGVTLKRTIVDKHCHIPDGFCAGFDGAHDRARGFHVSERGITLISPEMLGQRIHRVVEPNPMAT
ncbi:MAG: glucose-1-phosphate adenylyltransferase [Parasulfuritortus sp.]|nr:glucose-1-phosphate adenylyltransferase [Parasulfuritortus sp.]